MRQTKRDGLSLMSRI